MQGQEILIVAETKTHMLLSVKAHLENQGYSVTLIPADMNTIHTFKQTICGIFIYADEALLEQTQALFFLKDRAVMDDVPVFFLGSPEDLNVLKKIIPAELILQSYLRPITIHVGEMVKRIDRAIAQSVVKKKVLVVDDSGPMLRTVKGWLEDKYNVFLVNSATAAIRYLALNRPDLILLDYDMPIIDGKQVLEAIRNESDYADIPVIFLTGKEDRESVLNVQGLRPEGYLLKSQGASVIRKAIDDFFAKQKAVI